MFPQKSRIIPKLDSKTYPLGEKSEHPDYPYALALVALSHSPGEHRLYSAMLSTPTENSNGNSFTARQLMTLTGITMAPAVTAAFPVLLRIFGGYQSARTIHFFTFLALAGFVVVHVVMVARSGFRRQMKGMTLGR